VQNSIEAAVCREGNPVQRLRDEGVGKAGLVAVQVPVKVPFRERRGRVGSRLGGRIGSRLRVGDLGRGGLGFRGGNGIAWLFTCGLMLLLAAPLRAVDLCVDGRGRGLRLGWGEAAVWNQAFDRYDHRKGLDLAGDDASGHFVAEIGQFPEPGQDLVATKVQLAQPFGFLSTSLSLTAARCSIM
jgi:hypothetical protein